MTYPTLTIRQHEDWVLAVQAHRGGRERDLRAATAEAHLYVARGGVLAPTQPVLAIRNAERGCISLVLARSHQNPAGVYWLEVAVVEDGKRSLVFVADVDIGGA